MFHRQSQYHIAHSRIRPRVKQQLAFQSLQHSLLVTAKAILGLQGMTLRSCQNAFFPGIPQLHGVTAGMHGRQCQKTLHGNAVFTAKSAAKTGGGNMDPLGRDLQSLRQFQPVTERSLGGSRQLQLTGCIHAGHAILRLQKGMFLPAQSNLQAGGYRALPEFCRAISLNDLGSKQNIAVGAVRMQERGRFRQRRCWIEYRRQYLIADLDVRQRGRQRLFGFRHHQRHGVAIVPHPLIGQNRLVFFEDTQTIFPLNITVRQYGDHARNRGSGCRVNPQDSGMRMLRTFYTGPDKMRRIQIGSKFFRAGYLGVSIKTRRASADFLDPRGNARPTCRLVVRHSRQRRRKFSVSSVLRPA